MARTYAQQVAEGRRLIAAETDTKWALGDLALEVAPSGTRSIAQTLATFADDIDVELDKLVVYRQCAEAWPPYSRRDASWTVHYILASHPKAEAIIDRLVKAGKATFTEAKRAIGADTEARNTPPRTPKAKAEKIKEMLADPAVREEVAKDYSVRRELDRTAHAQYERSSAATKRKLREDAPSFAESSDMLDVCRLVTKMRTDGTKACELLAGLSPLNASQKHALNRDLGYLDGVLIVLNQYAETGRGDTLADEVSDFLAGEASR